MIFPIGDTNVKGGAYPVFSYLFIAFNVLVFLYQFMINDITCSYAMIPNDISEGKNYYTLITNMFMHGGWMHLIGNMMFLWVFADNIEAVIGNAFFVVFYIAGGIIGSLAHAYLGVGELAANCCTICESLISLQPACDLSIGSSPNVCHGSIPSLGASGAISAVLGAYLVMFPKSKIKVWAFFMTFTITALLFLGLWIAQQLVAGIGALGTLTSATSASGGTAYWAHIGGFVFGVLCGFFFKSVFPRINHFGKSTRYFEGEKQGF